LVTDTCIVVVNWNGAALLPSCLRALARSCRPVRVIVVDNGSTDGSAEVVRSFPDAEWIGLEQNTGFAVASNVGFRRALDAGARWVGMVNPDVEVEPGWVDALVVAGEAHPEAALLGGLLVFGDDPDRVNSTGLELDRFWRIRDRDFGAPLAEVSRPDGPALGVTGGAALARAAALRAIGLFDPAYFAYYEDADLSLRAGERGLRCWYVPAARARHGFGKSFGPGSPNQKYLLARNHLRFAAVHGPWALAVLLVPLLAATRILLKAPMELVRGRSALASAHLRAAVDGARTAAGALRKRLLASSRFPPGAEPETSDPVAER
jgi:GT2 family glycosyltransferase